MFSGSASQTDCVVIIASDRPSAARLESLRRSAAWSVIRLQCGCIHVPANSQNLSLISRFIIITGNLVCIYLHVTGADVYVLYKKSWPVQTVV